jgi:hypothetical protein
VFLLTSPLNFRIHGYPDDYWRMTPSCLRRMIAPYAARIVGWQGHEAFPHTVMCLGVKSPAPSDFARHAERMIERYKAWLSHTEASLPLAVKLRRAVAQVYRSKGERLQLAHYHRAGFQFDMSAPLVKAG